MLDLDLVVGAFVLHLCEAQPRDPALLLVAVAQLQHVTRHKSAAAWLCHLLLLYHVVGHTLVNDVGCPVLVLAATQCKMQCICAGQCCSFFPVLAPLIGLLLACSACAAFISCILNANCM